MKKLLFATIIFFAFSNQFLNAQHIRLDKKEMAFLASQEKVNVVFTYDSVHFNEDNFSEGQFLEYIKEKIEHKRNLEEALIWEKKYFKSKDSIFPEIFVAALNNRIKDYDYPVTF
ncbi:MAG: hypothetical protein KDC78_10680, partial [Aequorivita sp.]|nr:hypothetical protein [Aequorivita sp.]